MSKSDGQFRNLRFTTNEAAIREARSEAKKQPKKRESRARGTVPSKPGPKKVEKTDLEIIEGMIAEGLVPSSARSEALKRLTWPSGSGCPQANYVLWKLFWCAGLGCTFPETDGQCPYDHAEVVRGYAMASQGTFVPDAIVQATQDVDSQEDYDDREFPILVQFIANNKLFRFRAKQLGFIPDGYAVVHTVNRVLADSREKRRFIEVDVQDLGGDVFAEPKLLEMFCSKYSIHVYGHEVARAREVACLPPIWDEWNDLMAKRKK